MNKLIILLSVLVGVSMAQAEQSTDAGCEETLAPKLLQVHYGLQINPETGLWENLNLAFDPSLLNRPIAWSEPVEIVIYPKPEVIEGIFQKPLAKGVDYYPEYQDAIAEMRAEALELFDQILELHKGDKEAAKQASIQGEVSAIQQWEYERNELLPYLSYNGKLHFDIKNFRRVSRYGWKLEGLILKEALVVALLLKSAESKLESIQIFAKDSPLTDCASGSCSIK